MVAYVDISNHVTVTKLHDDKELHIQYILVLLAYGANLATSSSAPLYNRLLISSRQWCHVTDEMHSAVGFWSL